MDYEKLRIRGVEVLSGVAMATEATDMRVELLVARPAMLSPTKTTPAFTPEPTLILTVAGEAEHGGLDPAWSDICSEGWRADGCLRPGGNKEYA